MGDWLTVLPGACAWKQDRARDNLFWSNGRNDEIRTASILELITPVEFGGNSMQVLLDAAIADAQDNGISILGSGAGHQQANIGLTRVKLENSYVFKKNN